MNEEPGAIHPTLKQQYRRCGKPGCRTCTSGALGHGPYWYAYWRQGGRRRSRYIGKQLPESVADCLPQSLRVRTLGAFQVRRGDVEITTQLTRRPKVLRLFHALLSAPDQRLQCEQVSEWLWPDRHPDVQKNNLNVTLYALRAVLKRMGVDAFRVQNTGGILAMVSGLPDAPGTHWQDAVAFERAALAAIKGISLADCRLALALYHGDYLAEWPYNEEITARRDDLRRMRVHLLEHMATLCAREGLWEEAVEHMHLVLRIDPYREDVAGNLMQVLAAHGRLHHALQVYHQLTDTFKQEMDQAPSEPISRLYSSLLARGIVILPNAAAPLTASNLPAPLTSFVGRAEEQQVVRRHLTKTRLVTIIGEGGSGKTRLALEVVGRLKSDFPGGVWLVELAHLPVSAGLPQAMAAALGLREIRGGDPLKAVADFLNAGAALLVLDNCEHLLPTCIKLAGDLLKACPALRILATSRERLGMIGETAWLVPTLSTPPGPDLGERPPNLNVETLMRYEAVRLFIERAETSNPDFVLTVTNAENVARICRTLDGLPLALELAASHLATIPVQRLADALADRFRLLTDGNRGALPRQQTLWATMDWSYELLNDAERILWQRASVFRGGWTDDAARDVCAGYGLAAAMLGPLLGGLANKSIIRIDVHSGVKRYHMLETVRQYGLARLHSG